MTKLPDRFWAKVDTTDTCWLWTGAVTTSGYGKTTIQSKQVYVHRLAYIALVGPIADGLVIDHKCRVKTCVRPDHLQPVTNELNMQNRDGAQANSKSGVRGVHPFQGRWRVQVKAGGKVYSGGIWDKLEHAEIAAQNLRMDVMTNNLADDF